MKTGVRRGGPQVVSHDPAAMSPSDLLMEIFRQETERMMREIMGANWYQNMGFRPLTRRRAAGPQGRRRSVA